MKYSSLVVAAAITPSVSAASGSCKSVGSSCSSMNLAGEYGCSGDIVALFGLECRWDATTSECLGPNPPTDCTTSKDQISCAKTASMGCAWDDHQTCDVFYDQALCSNSNSEFYKCNVGLATSWVDDMFEDFSGSFSSDVIGEYKNKAICGCLPLYFNCLYSTDCGNPINRAIFEETCQNVVNQMVGFFGDTSCDDTWCESVGVTTDESIWDIVFDFDTEAKDWSEEKLAEFKLAIEVEVGGSIDLDWIKFDKNTNKVTITIPEGIVISKDEMLAMIEALKALATQPVMKETFKTQAVTVTTKQTASVDENQWPPGSGSTRFLSGVAAVVALGVVLETFVVGF